MRLLASALLALVGTALVACAGSAAPAPDGAAGPSDAAILPRVELGTGNASFVAIGETIELVMGPQGGWHVDVALRIWGLDPRGISVVYEVVRLRDGALLSRTSFLFDAGRFVPEGDHLVHTGDIAILDVTSASEIVGDEIELRVTASARDGTSARDARRTTVVDER